MIELLISSAILITVLALMRFLFRGRISPGLQYAVWLVVLLRLALPFSMFPSSVSAAGAVSQAMQASEAEAAEQAGLPSTSPAVTVTSTADAEKPGPEQVLGYVWISGSVVMGVWFGVVNRKLTVRLRKSRRLEYSAPIPIYSTDELSSPCLYGLFHPAVYLTEEAVRDPQRERIAVTHELTHWRHRDNLWSIARVLCLIVYWYDPFVWLAAWLSKQDGELFCDDSAIRMLGEEHRFAYGRALLDLSEAGARPSDLICSASTMSGGARRMRERIAAIARRPKRSVVPNAAAGILALTAVICTFSSPSAALEAEPMEITPTSPPMILETPTPDDVETTLPPAAIYDADAQKIVVLTPVPTQIPSSTLSPVPAQSTSVTPVPIEADQEDTTDVETPSGGGGAPPIQWVQAASGGSTPSEPPADFAVIETPPPIQADDMPNDETQQAVVHDMRDVYRNSDVESPMDSTVPDMPSTVPDSPPPVSIQEPAE